MKILHEGKYLNFIQEGRWEYVTRNNCSGIVSVFPMKENGTLIFTEQYRTSVKNWVIEFPAGLVGDSGEKESLEKAALRELEEEVGYTASKLMHIFEGPPSAGLSSETIHFYRAQGLKKIGNGGGDGSEKIIVHEVPAAEIDPFLENKLKEGKLVDPKFYVGLYFLKGNKRY